LLLLFDIDGTLTAGGPGKTAFRIALERTYGTAGPIVNHDFSGKTDPLLLRELLSAAGHAPQEIEAGRTRFWKVYLAELEARIGSEPVTVLPGVRELIGVLAERGDVHLGLLTVVIGDTPRDVECGMAVGADTVAVTTGRFSKEELARAGAGRVLSGFADVGEAMAAILP